MVGWGGGGGRMGGGGRGRGYILHMMQWMSLADVPPKYETGCSHQTSY